MKKEFRQLPDLEEFGRGKYCAFYSALFVLIAFVIFLPWILQQRSLISYGGGASEQYPAYVYLGKFCRNVIYTFLNTGKLHFPTWDATLGYGSDILSSMTHLSFGDPLNLISVVIPTRFAELSYNVVCLLRVYLTGLTFSYFCFYRGKKKGITVLGALVYSTIGLTMLFGLAHPTVVSGMVLLPLMCVSLHKLLQGKKNVGFCILILISLVTNMYMTIVLGAALAVYAIVICHREKGWSRKSGIRLAIQCCLGILMSAMAVIPIFNYRLQSICDCKWWPVLLVPIFGLFLLAQKWPKYYRLGLWFALSIEIVGSLMFGLLAKAPRSYVPNGKAYNYVTSAGVAKVREMASSKAYYRIDAMEEKEYNGGILDRSMLLSSRFPMTDKHLIEFQRNLGNAHCDDDGSIKDLDQRPMLNLLFGVRYLTIPTEEVARHAVPYGYSMREAVFSEEMDKTFREIQIHKSKYRLPMIFGYRKVIMEEEWKKLSPIDKEASLLDGAVVNETTNELQTITPMKSGKVVLTKDQLLEQISQKKEKTFRVKDGKIFVDVGHASVDLHFNGEIDATSYLSIKENGTASGREIQATNVKNENKCKLSSHEICMNLGYSEKAQTGLTLSFNEPGEYDFGQFAVVCQPMKKIQSALAPMKLAIQGFRIKGDVITARLSLEKKCLVTLSIPYSDGFRAEVNGEKVPLIRVNQMMLGYYASPGDQKLSIYYEPPGMRIGFYLSLLGILLTIILGIIYGICNERDKEHEGGFQNGVQ